MKKLNVAIIGQGRSGRNIHGAFFKSESNTLFNVVAVVERDPARRELAKHGLSCSGKYARQMTAADYERYDYIPIMDRNNQRNIMRIIGSDPENKVRLLMEYAGSTRDVADPWYTGDFAVTWDDITKGCRALLETIRKERSI